MDLAKFLEARIGDDKAKWEGELGRHARMCYECGANQARMLREVDAKRAILAEAQAVRKLLDLTGGEQDRYRDWILRHLASVYADHPDYDEGWRL